MKIAIAGGHSKKSPGASKYLDEYQCDRAYVAKLISALRAAGHTVVDCSNEEGDQNSELAEEVRLANASRADLFLAVHLNAGGGTGTEAYTYTETTSKLAKDVCAKMSANVAAALGIRNRGAKAANFYVLRKTTMPAVLLEVCFVDSATDRDAWNRTSWDALTKAVVNAIGGSAASKPSASKPAAPKPSSGGSAASVPRGTYKCMASKLNVRDKASTSGKVVASYSKGQTVVLDNWCAVANGYVWGRYTGASGKTRYIAVRTADGKSTYLKKI